MDTSKLITVTIWATLALIAYEVYKGYLTRQNAANAQQALQTPATQSLLNSLVPTIAETASPALDGIVGDALAGNFSLSPAFFASGGEAGVLGNFGF